MPRNTLDYDSSFMDRVSTLCDLILLNLFFILSCIPVVTIGAAVSAMSHVTMRIVRRADGGVWNTYWSSFRSNFGQATLSWLAFLGVCAVLLVDYWILPVMLPGLYQIPRVIIVIAFLGALSVILYLLPIVSHFRCTWKQAVKNALLMMVAHFPSTALLLIVHGICLLVPLLPELTFLYAACVFLICGFSLLSLFSSYLLNRIFIRYESI